MESPTSLTTENPQPRRLSGVGARGTPAAADDIDAAYSDERPSQDPWLSEAPPTRDAAGVLGGLAFYYGACWLYHRSTPPRRGKMR